MEGGLILANKEGEAGRIVRLTEDHKICKNQILADSRVRKHSED